MISFDELYGVRITGPHASCFIGNHRRVCHPDSDERSPFERQSSTSFSTQDGDDENIELSMLR